MQTTPMQAISSKLPVVLLHGLARTSRAMRPLEKSLSTSYLVANIDYPSTKHNIETLAHTFVLPSIMSFLQKHHLAHDQPLCFVTHSMGGIILRVLAKTATLNMCRAVMLAPPNQGSEAVDALGHLAPFFWLNGPAGRQLATSACTHKRLTSLPRQLGSIDFNCGIIAGDTMTHYIKEPTSLLLPKPNDGKVSVASTKLCGMSEHIVLPYNHTFIMNKHATIAKVQEFLARGAFK